MGFTTAWPIVRWLRIPVNALLFTGGHPTAVQEICVHISVTGSNFIKKVARKQLLLVYKKVFKQPCCRYATQVVLRLPLQVTSR